MSSTQPAVAEYDAVELAVAAGIAPMDAVQIVGVPLPARYGDRAARTTEYCVRRLAEGEVRAFDPLSGRVVWGARGWYISRLDGLAIADDARNAFRALARAALVPATGAAQ